MSAKLQAWVWIATWEQRIIPFAVPVIRGDVG